jgi:hypothetical protein
MRLPRMTSLISGAASAGTSIVCMGSMGAMAAGSTAAGMSGMGAAATSTAHDTPVLTRALEALGLGALTQIPNTVLQPLLIALLAITIVSALWRALGARTTSAIVLATLTILSGIGLYISIYAFASTAGYWIALTVLVLASLLSLRSGHRGRTLPS